MSEKSKINTDLIIKRICKISNDPKLKRLLKVYRYNEEELKLIRRQTLLVRRQQRAKAHMDGFELLSNLI